MMLLPPVETKESVSLTRVASRQINGNTGIPFLWRNIVIPLSEPKGSTSLLRKVFRQTGLQFSSAAKEYTEKRLTQHSPHSLSSSTSSFSLRSLSSTG